MIKILDTLTPYDQLEEEHIAFAKKWVDSGAPLYRTEKPATPDPHLVSYFLLIDQATNKILLVDHRKANLWLPAGGHVELNEDPKDTVKREMLEELNIEADFLMPNPFFLTVTKTKGQAGPHTDVSLWYLLKGNSKITYKFDTSEFYQIKWFELKDIPYSQSDPHMSRSINKLTATGFLCKL